MKHAKKLVAMLLLLCLAVPMFAACGKAGDDTTAANTSENQDSGSQDMSNVVEVPEVTFDGYEFTFLTGSNVSTCPYIFTDDEEGNAIDEAIHRRNVEIEDKYDITITEIRIQKNSTAGAGAAYTEISKAWESNDVIYDAAVSSAYDCGTLAQSGMLADLRDYGYVKLSKVWWDQAANEQLTIYDKIFFTAGDISYIDDNFTYAITFNKDLALRLQFEDMYQLVRDGKWTYDKLYTLSKQATSLDIVDGFSEGDVYGFLGYNDTTWMSFSSTGSTIAAINNDGELELTLNSEKNFNLIQKWTEFGKDQSFVNWQMDAAAKTVGWKQIYANNQALFFGATIDGIYKLRDTELDYGFLPWPKYDEEQEEYRSGMSPNHISLFCIPDIGDDEHIERNSILVEAISAASDIVIEGFYKKNLEGKSVKDNESYETLEIIFANKVFDLGYYYNIGSYRAGMSVRFRDGLTNFASFYAEQEGAANQKIAEINDLYKKVVEVE